MAEPPGTAAVSPLAAPAPRPYSTEMAGRVAAVFNQQEMTRICVLIAQPSWAFAFTASTGRPLQARA